MLAQLEMNVSAWMDDPLAIELLQTGIESTKSEVRKAAIGALERRGGAQEQEILRAALTQVTGVTRLQVAEALAEVGVRHSKIGLFATPAPKKWV